MPTFRNTGDEKALLVQLEPVRHPKAYTVSAIIPNGGESRIIFLPPDGDFLLSFLSGSAQGPVNAAGVHLPAGATIFPAPGTTTGYAVAGLEIQINDLSTGDRQLTRPRQNLQPLATLQRDFTPIQNLFTPGYGFGPFFRMTPFQYMIPKGGQFSIALRNQDTGGASQNHRLDLCFLGMIYER